MAFSVGTLTNYTNEQKLPLIVKSVFGAKTISLMTPHTGIKSAEAINIMSSDAIFQAGGTCGFSSSGTTALTQRILTVGKIKVQEALCPKTLEAKWVQSQLPLGSMYDSIPFEQQLAEEKAAKIAAALETAVWQGDTASGDGQLNKFDGLAKIIKAAADEIIATAQADVDSTTIRGIIKDIYTKLPAAIIDKDDVRLFMGWDNFRVLINKLTDDNLFHYTTDGAAGTGELVYPGTNLRIVAVHGLNGTDEMYALRLSNMFFGTDLQNEEERFDIFFAKEADEVRYMAEFKAGVQVAFTDQIVRYQNI